MTSVIIDCDPGHDDALAILLAAKHLDVLGITTVSGNESIDNVTTNALKLVEVGNLTHIPVVRGAEGPLLREAVYALDSITKSWSINEYSIGFKKGTKTA